VTATLAVALLAVAVGLALLLLDVLIRREAVAVGLVLLLVVVDAALPGDLTSVTVGGLRVSAADVGYALVAAAAVARFLHLRRTPAGQQLLVLLAGVLLLSLLRGAAESVPSAFNEFRSYLAYIAAAAYAATARVDVTTREAIGRTWLWAGGAMAVLVSVRWTARFAGVGIGPVDATYDAAIRALSGPETMMLANCAIVALLPALDGERRPVSERQLGVLLLVMTIILNRRTVWVVLAVVLLAMVLRNPVIGRRLTAAAVIGVAAFAVVVPFLPGASGEDAPAVQTATDTGTFEWRLEGWMNLIDGGPDEPVEVAVGQPFGRGYAREVEGQLLESTPHNFYIQTYLRSGVIGVLALLGVAGYAAVRIHGGRKVDGLLGSETLLVLLLAQAVWFLTWGPSPEQGLLLGLAVAVATRRPSPADGAARHPGPGEGASRTIPRRGVMSPGTG
jgi:hypothetical protein